MSLDGSSGSLPTPPVSAPAADRKKQLADVLAGREPSPTRTPANGDGEGTKAPQTTSSREAPRSPESSRPTRDEDLSSRPALELDDDDEDFSSQEDRQEQAKAKELREFAKEHGISVKQAMRMLVDFPGEDGLEPVTIADLKDRWRESRQFEQQRTEFEDWHDQAQAVIMSSQRQMQEVIARVSHVVRPEVMARILSDVGTDDVAELEKNRAQMLEMFPEWRDAQQLTAARDKMVTHLSTYGFKKQEIAGLRDARMVKFVMDALKLRERYDRLKNGGIREGQASTPAPPSRKGHRPSIDERAKALAEGGNKSAAVAMLIKEGSRK